MLQLRFEPDTDGTGELFVHAESDGFAGHASAWFSFDQIRQFGEQLATRFPLQPGEALTLAGGYWRHGAQPPQLEEALVELRVYPVGTTGAVGIAVALMEERHEGQRPDSRAHVRLELFTDYQTLQTLGHGIAGLVRGGTVGL